MNIVCNSDVSVETNRSGCTRREI